ncbi:bifunctional aspartate kinase/homoserine dehydrogenase I [Longimonas halophila]|uniref:Bifunctional aspartate kinase/homoserine dehydrogenase I n=1 Tax=Longimonas halophila TaxID=1469170 RepID=A0A2H3NXD9_9BACT|nr:bifunctional aspartate kinase/homoserine dehydrogenase I [Longimonas halophila]PEN05013.1 bifunctional aspartate kinase/homoserine dehydrogenase I [Longimonas halophila]
MPSPTPWTVYKFGGTSLADAERLQHATTLIQRCTSPCAAVVSAMGGTTDALMALTDTTRPHTERLDQLDVLRDAQHNHIRSVLQGAIAHETTDALNRDVQTIRDVLQTTELLGTVSDTARDLIAGFGEVWSARLVAAALQEAGASVALLNAREVIVATHTELGPTVDWEATRTRWTRWHEGHADADVLVVTGYIATTPEGAPTTLGRNGSDFSAAIMASLLEAEAVHIWTDVDGVMTADPRLVPDAQRLDAISYQEAMELAYFGAKVIHPRTLAPAFDREIPIHIRNTFSPEDPGTCIHLDGEADRPVKGFATINDLALLNLEGSGMMGVPGIARRLFSALEAANVSVVVISQGSSEHSICFAVPQPQADAARKAAQDAFYAEIHQGHLHPVQVTDNCSVLAVVGDRMAGTPGIAATFFGALGQAGVNVRAMAQGSSERNITAVIDGADATKGLRAAHAGFYLSNHTLSVGIIGPGNVGGALLEQLEAQAERLRTEQHIDIRVRGIANSSYMALDEQRLDLDGWQDAIREQAHPSDLDVLADHIQTDYHPHAVLIDCTSSPAVAARYERWLRRGIHVVTPNKKASTAPLDAYRTLQEARRSASARYLYETTVGAGLPIIQTLNNLIETGDRVLRIEGILSGTLSYLFNAFDGERAFSDILREAKANGFTEPDPRDDLSGMDVARKVVILGREMGLDITLDDVAVESLVPDALTNGSVDAFMAGLPEHDDAMTRILREAREAGQVLRFVGAVDHTGEASVRLGRYDDDHAFARIHRTDNIVQFRTERYNENPLIVQGPGAGPDVTAAGVFADLLRIVDA